ncbi:uncharacterized protein [Macrobrachium rosenbergii]|uniref:uncharacterized protein n=1 Tax=Macrobrachium rosenbergii TaxID=79674 RepID=UPI0034D4AAD0
MPPGDHSLTSSPEFLEALRVTPPRGITALMDVESLFTNVPVDKTTQKILDHVCRDPTTPSLNIPEHALCALLEICTNKAPFSTHRGHMYTQIDGIAMGSPLGVLFANFYMDTVKKRVFNNIRNPQMCMRYSDDTFVSTETRNSVVSLGESIASLDVKSLFTRIPVDKTINITLRRICHSDATPHKFKGDLTTPNLYYGGLLPLT